MLRAHEGLQYLAASGVAPRVVDGLEVIEVEQGHAERHAGALGAAPFLLETRHQRAAGERLPPLVVADELAHLVHTDRQTAPAFVAAGSHTQRGHTCGKSAPP